jgi:predicted porin
MKKSLIALAVLAASGAAMAQSSVTLFGIVDAGVAYQKSTGSGHTTGLINGGNGTSRLGFRGTEDLGGGLAASFWLEGALANDSGGGNGATGGFDFMRRSTVSLSGAFGEVRMGRDFAASYLPYISYDVTGNRGYSEIELFGGAASGTGLNVIRVSNAISYFLPATLGGFYGNVQYAFGEKSSSTTATTNAAGFSTTAALAGTNKTGNYMGGRLGYANGPLDVSGSLGQFSDVVRTVSATQFYSADYKVANIGASYDFGVVKPMFLYNVDKIDGQGAVAKYELSTISIGATAPLGAGVLKLQGQHYDTKDSSNDANKISLGYVYNLSKRTAVYADVARLKNKGAATFANQGVGGLAVPAPTAGGTSTAFAVGVKHAF